MLQVAGDQVRAGGQRPDVREAQDQPEESGGRGGGRIRDVSLAGHHQGQEDEVGMDRVYGVGHLVAEHCLLTSN